MPGFGRPIALRSPVFNSTTQGFSCPAPGCKEMDFVVRAPAPAFSIDFNKPAVFPSIPDTKTVGFFNVRF